MNPSPLPDQREAPQVTFFVESREESDEAITQGLVSTRGEFLLNRLGERDVIEALQSVRGRVAIAMNEREIRTDRALIDWIREYNVLDIDVDVWPTFDDEDGYWIHAGNVSRAQEKVLRIIEALESFGVHFQNIGLDLEFPIGVMKDGFHFRKWLAMKLWKYSQPDTKIYLVNLIEEILRTSQYGVHTYEVPVLGDNPRLRRLLGIPEAPEMIPTASPDRFKRVGLVYTSVTPKLIARDPAKFVKKYSSGHGRIPALGIVSASEINPGRDLGGTVRFLNDEELQRDVRAALEVSPTELFMFALNGKPVIDRTRAAIEAALGAYFPVKV